MIFLRKLYLKFTHISNRELFWFTLFIIFTSAVIIHSLEPDRYPTVFDGIWWTVVTMSTVGYGDFFPVTVIGKIYGMGLMLFGIGLLTVVIGKIVEYFTSIKKRRVEGKMDYKESNHIVIIGWSQKARYAVNDILSRDAKTEIVIIDQMAEAPYLEERLHYVQGDPAMDKTLHQANLTKAKAVLIFADDQINNATFADGKSILVAISVERIAPDVHVTVEIMREEHIADFQFVNKNNFTYVLSDQTISKMAVDSALRA